MSGPNDIPTERHDDKTEPVYVAAVDLDRIRGRVERALSFVREAAPDGVRDEHKTRRAAYILVVNDVPALLAEVERLRAELAEAYEAEYEIRKLREQLERLGITQAWRERSLMHEPPAVAS